MLIKRIVGGEDLVSFSAHFRDGWSREKEGRKDLFGVASFVEFSFTYNSTFSPLFFRREISYRVRLVRIFDRIF